MSITSKISRKIVMCAYWAPYTLLWDMKFCAPVRCAVSQTKISLTLKHTFLYNIHLRTKFQFFSNSFIHVLRYILFCDVRSRTIRSKYTPCILFCSMKLWRVRCSYTTNIQADRLKCILYLLFISQKLLLLKYITVAADN